MDPGRKAGAKKSIPAQTHMRLVELSMPSILAQTVSVTRISMPESIPFVPSGAVLYRREHGPQYSASPCRRSLDRISPEINGYWQSRGMTVRKVSGV